MKYARLSFALACFALGTGATIVYAQPKPIVPIAQETKLGNVSATLACFSSGSSTFTATILGGQLPTEGTLTIQDQGGGAKLSGAWKAGSNASTTVTLTNNGTLAVSCVKPAVYIATMQITVNGAKTQSKYLAMSGMNYSETQAPP